jgi:hypothetical protein
MGSAQTIKSFLVPAGRALPFFQKRTAFFLHPIALGAASGQENRL